MSAVAERKRVAPIGAAGWNLLLVLTASQMLAYIDRVNLSVAGPVLIHAHHYTPKTLGALFSIFNWAFTIALLPSGPFVDWVRARVAYPVGVALWSVATMLCGVTFAFTPLAAFRALVGIGEAPMIPAGQRVIAETLPLERRAFAIGTFFAGNKIGLAIGLPFAAILLHTLGLGAVFYITGALGFVWIAWFLVSYRGAPPTAIAPAARAESTIRWGTLLRYRQTWGIMLGQAGYLYIYFVFATWLPGYLVLQRHMSDLNSGFVGMLPFVFGVIATIFGGWAGDRLVSAGVRVTLARKIFAVGGLFLATVFTLLGAYASGTVAAVTFLTLSIVSFSLSTGSIQSMAVDIAPPHIVSSLVSLQNFGGNVGGSFAPLVTGFLISDAGSFQVPLLVTAAVALVFGCGSYGILVGDLDKKLTAPVSGRSYGAAAPRE
ncbi:MAG TPA: MFS transporter [Candidatus Limnocylindria bacterium]|jgi:ACS family D-galactonate transporter-like MFS transporter|nr:MFS transporter [Candidatus Limnocylindria bacterium]